MTTQNDIINDLQVSVQDDIESIIRERVDFLKRYLIDSNCTSYVLGISGGVDSLTAGLLAQQAVNELNDNGYPARFIAVKLPYGVQADEKYVHRALATINPTKVEYANIQEITNAVERSVDDVLTKKSDSQRDFIRGNIKARSRMVVQYTIANAENGLVIGTDHSAEAVTGFFTKHGDGACDIIPLSGLVKQTVRDIAKHYGASEDLYNKTATADLEDNKVNLPDEEALGISYADIDAFLLGKIIPKNVEDKIINRYNATVHKRSLPVSPPVESTTAKTQWLQFKLTDIPNDFRLLLDEIEMYAAKNKLPVIDVLHSLEHVCSIFEYMTKEGTYSTTADNLWYWYYDISTAYDIRFEIVGTSIGDLLFGEPIDQWSTTFIDDLNKLNHVINAAYIDDNHELGSLNLPTLQ